MNVVRGGDDGISRSVEVLEDGAYQPAGDAATTIANVNGHVFFSLHSEHCK
jgi:hypothetical protein